jgi:hypothetical protein
VSIPLREPCARPAAASSSVTRERRIVAVVAVLIVLMRSAVFVFWEEAQFDSDQAVMGLAAKHLSELRAFPLFFYGSNHILAVEAWLAAPLFALAGTSVTALKLPLLGINVAIALLLLRMLERDAKLRPRLALLPALFFILPAPGTAAHFVDASGGNVEPFLYAVLLWLVRRRGVVLGLVFAVGFLHREFTLYPLLAVLLIEARDRSLFTRTAARRWAVSFCAAIAMWASVYALKSVANPMGPGTSMADVRGAQSSFRELQTRFCVEPGAILPALTKMAAEHWPSLFGTRPQPLLDFAIDSNLRQGFPYGSIVLAMAVGSAILGIGRGWWLQRRWRREYDVAVYLLLTGALSSAGLIVARCGHVEVMRYDLLSILGAVGLGALLLAAPSGPAFRRLWIVLACSTVAIGGVAHARLLFEYLTHRHHGAKRQIALNLEARGVRYATSDYWLAYSITFLTNERVIVASEDLVRIASYQDAVAAHRDAAIRISRGPCADGARVAGVYFCR